MQLYNTEHITDKEFDTIKLVKGSTVYSTNFVRDWFAGLKNLVGGEIKGYTEMMNEAREQATDRMIQEARDCNADAIINVRFSTASIMNGAAEIIAYGTAVKFKA